MGRHTYIHSNSVLSVIIHVYEMVKASSEGAAIVRESQERLPGRVKACLCTESTVNRMVGEGQFD